MPTDKRMQARSLSDTRFRSRQASRNIAARRRARFVARIEAMPDAPERWEWQALRILLQHWARSVRDITGAAIAPSAAATPYPSPTVRAV